MMTRDQEAALGAAMLEEARGIPGFYQVQSQNGGRKPVRTAERSLILQSLADGPKFTKEIAPVINFTVKETAALLQSMQKKGTVKKMDDCKPVIWGLPDA